MIFCKCGCKEPLYSKDKKRRKTLYIQGHNRAGLASNYKPTSKNKSTAYARSKKTFNNLKSCKWKKIGFCKGVIDICHIDQNYLNNSRLNLISLCRSHHRLMDNGKIDYKKPIMPKFYTDKSGKRRYGSDNS